MNNALYQVLHPWHWLTYGQNATAVAALAAVAGLIGLFFYTRYTRQMMTMQETTVRETITPVLVMQGDSQFIPTKKHFVNPAAGILGREEPKVTEYKAVLKIRNIGAGAALFLSGWAQPVSDKFVDNPQMVFNKTPHSKTGQAGLTELLRGESTTLTFEGLPPEVLHQRWLFVVDSIDQTNERHQFHLIRTPIDEETTEKSVSMVHGVRRERG